MEVDINKPIDEDMEDKDFQYIEPRNPRKDMLIFILTILTLIILYNLL